MRTTTRIAALALAFWAAAAPAMLRTPEVKPAGAAQAALTATAARAGAPQVVQISARRYRFEPSSITLRRGQAVKLVLSSKDRVHGFMNRPLGIDTDIPPGKPTEITITPQAAGTFRAICDHYCGLGHNGMKMTIVVQ